MVVQLLLAWPIGAHFASPDLGLAVAALAIVHVIYPLSMVNVYIAQRNECWGQVSFAMAGQAGIDNLLTAVLAVSGFGIWAVAIPKLIVAALWVMWHRSMSPWRPCALVERPNYRSHFAYAGRVLAVEMLSTLRAHGDKALVGAMLGSTALGLYAFAANIGKGLTLSLSQALSSVILPFLSRGRASGHLQRSHRQTLADAGPSPPCKQQVRPPCPAALPWPCR